MERAERFLILSEYNNFWDTFRNSKTWKFSGPCVLDNLKELYHVGWLIDNINSGLFLSTGKL